MKTLVMIAVLLFTPFLDAATSTFRISVNVLSSATVNTVDVINGVSSNEYYHIEVSESQGVTTMIVCFD